MIVAIIQARYSSTRLPGKILMEINDKSILDYVINQVQHSKKIDKIVVASPKKTQDDLVVNSINSSNVEVFRGSENDVLDRYYQCAKNYNAMLLYELPLIALLLIQL